MKRRNPHDGSSFESFLKEEGVLEETRERAIKAVLAWQLARAMKARKISKSAMAKRLDTSRSQLDRLLDPKNDNVTLRTLSKAARAIGKRLRIDLVDAA
jgi:DNA-binding Xre family transcriptional regulator